MKFRKNSNHRIIPAPTRQLSADDATPTTMARDICLQNKTPSKKESQELSKRWLKLTNIEEYDNLGLGGESPTITSTRPPRMRSLKEDLKITAADLNLSYNQTLQTTGDCVAALLPGITSSEKYNLKIGSVKERATNANLRKEKPSEFEELGKMAFDMHINLLEKLYPANPTELLNWTAAAATDQLNSIQHDEFDADTNRRLSEVIALKETLKRGSISRRTLNVAQYMMQQPHQCTMSRQSKRKAKEDLEYMKENNDIQVIRHSRQRKNPLAIHATVDFILSEDNIQVLSWGTKTILRKIGKTKYKYILPTLTRKKSRALMWQQYKQEFPEAEVGRTIFMEIATLITSTDYKSITCVDYVLGNLINDPVQKMQEIIDAFLKPSTKEYRDLVFHLKHVRHFLKTRFDHHIIKNDGFIYHSMDHALTKQRLHSTSHCRSMQCSVCIPTTAGATASLHQHCCDGCSFPTWFCNSLEAYITDAEKESISDVPVLEEKGTIYLKPAETSMYQDAIRVTRDCQEKFYFFMRHRYRVLCERRAFQLSREELKEYSEKYKTVGRKCIIIIDWKMKFEALSTRETMPENFGKRGLPWHGAVVIYFIWCEKSKQSVQKMKYIDQIMTGGSKQDCFAVLALFEAVINSIIVNIPFLKEGTAISDNAGCYTAKTALLVIPILNIKNKEKFFVRSWNHSETQDGKGAVDAHFAIASNHLLQYMKCVKDNKVIRINTEQDLADALAWNGGIPNSIVQLVHVDRERSKEICDFFKAITNKAKKYISRACEVEFPEPKDSDHEIIEDIDDWNNWEAVKCQLQKLTIQFQARAHSNYGSRVGFEFDLGAMKITLDENAEAEYQLNLGKEPTKIGRYVAAPDDDEEVSNLCEGEEEKTNYHDDQEEDAGGAEEDGVIGQDFEIITFDDIRSSLVDSDHIYLSDSCDEDGESDSDEDTSSEVGVASSKNNKTFSEPTEDILQSFSFFSTCTINKTSYFSDTTGGMEYASTNSCEIVECDGNEINTTNLKDSVSVALAYATSLVSTESSRIVSANNDEHLDKIYKVAKDTVPKQMPKPGFARRDNGGGDLFGARYIGECNYKQIVKEEYEKGETNSSQKVSPAQVLQRIEKEHAYKFSHPTLQEIRAAMNALVNDKKGGRNVSQNELTNDQEQVNRQQSTKYKLSSQHAHWVKSFLYGNNIDKTPKQVFGEMKLSLDLSEDDLAHESEIRKEISSIKSQKKNQAWLVV
jgi:hypothetical protein